MLPDFVCIGSQKAGTGWLNWGLKFHPHIWLPPIKELHYFTRPSNFYILSLFSGDRLRRRSVTQDLKRCWFSLRENPREVGWFGRFFLLPRNHGWYGSLFNPGEEQICGEVTPAYETLPVEKVAEFHRLLPDTKILLMMRSPIGRIWSSLAMDFRKKGYTSLDDVKEEAIKGYLAENENTIKRSDYLNTLEIWESYYPSEQIFTGFQDQMKDDPEGLLSSIHRFLGLETSAAYLPKNLDRRQNVGAYPEIPGSISGMLAEHFLEPVERLHERFQNSYTEKWVNDTRRMLNKA